MLNNLTQSPPLLLVFNELSMLPHDTVNYFNNFAEAADSAFDLHKACNRKANLAAMLEDDEELDPERYWLDIQRVNFVDTRGDDVGLARVLKVPNAMSLPLFEENDDFLAGSTPWNIEAEQRNSGFDVEEACEPRSLVTGGGWMVVARWRRRL